MLQSHVFHPLSRLRNHRLIRSLYYLVQHQRCFNVSSTFLQQPAVSTDDHGKRRTLVILGTGWGSYAVLNNIDKRLFDVIVISPRNHFLFTPLLCSTTVGTLEFRSIVEPIRNSKFREESHYHYGSAVSLDTAAREIICQSSAGGDNYRVPYDFLVVGVGAQANTFNIAGVEEHAFFLKEIIDAQKIRRRLLTNFEKAALPHVSAEEKDRLHHIVIVGGGPTGVEFGAEVYDFVQQDIKRLYTTTRANVRVTLVEGNNILASFDRRLQNYVEKKMSKRENFHLVKDMVTEVTAEGVHLKERGFLPCGLVVWSTGLAPRPFTKTLPFRKNKMGQILTDTHLRVLDGESSSACGDSVFALGDCADIETKNLPCTAQVAEKQGRYLAEQLNGKKAKVPFVYKNFVMLAYIGSYEAVGDFTVVQSRGVGGWLLWRSAYMTRLGSWRLRMQVPVDWTKAILFGRDTSVFGESRRS